MSKNWTKEMPKEMRERRDTLRDAVSRLNYDYTVQTGIEGITRSRVNIIAKRLRVDAAVATLRAEFYEWVASVYGADTFIQDLWGDDSIEFIALPDPKPATPSEPLIPGE